MFCVLFEVHPKADGWDAYLGYAKRLAPELERTDGFLDNVRYRSLTRPGWVLSLSTWRDERALVRWRAHPQHHEVQRKGRDDVFDDYRLRVGQATRDSRPPAGLTPRDQRLDATEAGGGTTVTVLDAPLAPQQVLQSGADGIAGLLGFRADAPGLVAWDAFGAILTPGDAMLLATWRDDGDARAFEQTLALRDGARLRRVRVVRDYGMFDRREAPQYHPDVRRKG